MPICPGNVVGRIEIGAMPIPENWIGEAVPRPRRDTSPAVTIEADLPRLHRELTAELGMLLDRLAAGRLAPRPKQPVAAGPIR